MTTLRVLSGGAAQGLVEALAPRYAAEGGPPIAGRFSAVGQMRDELIAGAGCDLLILTRKLIDDLTASGHLRAGTARDLGLVRTGIAVKTGAARAAIATPEDLAQAFERARGIYFPDPEKATAGIHAMKVLRELGLAPRLADRFRTFPNGNIAMRAMADCDEADLIGCTQITEILYTPGVELAGPLPKAFELATRYAAAIPATARQPRAAASLLALLTSPEQAALRARCGFE